MGFYRPKNHQSDFFRLRLDESGQILLVVVLAAVISLTVGLSVASRVITNTKTTTDEVNAQKALSAAQTGVEQSLKTNTAASISFGNGSSVATKPLTPISTSQFVINGGNLVSQDDGVDIWLSDHGAGTDPTYNLPRDLNMKIYWKDNVAAGSNPCSANPALEVVVLSGTTASTAVKRYLLDTCASRKNTNNFTDTYTDQNKTISGVTFNHFALIPVSSGLIARVVPLYADTRLAVEFFAANSTTDALSNPPSQGYLIESIGTAGNVTRTLRVFQGYPKVPTEYFPYTLFIP